MDIEKGAEALVNSFNKNMSRSVLRAIAIIISVTTYQYIVTPYPDRDLFGQVGRWLFYNGYDFYSGQDKGSYSAIGEALDKGTSGGLGIKITNRVTTGGVDNATKVASSTSAFGLVQEDSISEGDFINDEIKFITPLYLEQVHILYRESRYRELTEDKDSSAKSSTVKVSLNKPVRTFFSKAIISSGSPLSGSSIVASQILNTLGVAPAQDRQTASGKALLRMIEDEKSSKKEGGLDAVFWITGGPNGVVTDALQAGNVNTKSGNGGNGEGGIKIMGIDPTIAQLINHTYKSKLRPSTFKGVYDIYDNHEGVPTIGVYSFLICSNDVPSFAVMDLLEVLEREKDQVKSAMEANSAMEYSAHNFQLDQFKFKEYYERDHRGFVIHLVKNIFMFLISVVVATAGMMTFLVWLISGLRQAAYFRRLMQLYKEYTPNNVDLDEKNLSFVKPEIYGNQLSVISRLAKGTRYLLLWGRDVRADYDRGIITTTHYNHLSKDFDKLRGIFQKNMSRRLCEVMYSSDAFETLDESHIRHYYTAGYIRRDDYEYLIEIFSNPKIRT